MHISLISKIDEARECYRLGRELRTAMARARALHPWVNRRRSLFALREEVEELAQEIILSRDVRTREEAIDVAVVALRIRDGA